MYTCISVLADNVLKGLNSEHFQKSPDNLWHPFFMRYINTHTYTTYVMGFKSSMFPIHSRPNVVWSALSIQYSF